MDDVSTWVAEAYEGLAGLLSPETWEAPSLCAGWQVRHVVAHVTMPVRLTPELFASEMASARGDFGVLSDTVAARDADLPCEVLLEQLRSPALHAWQPPGGGAAGAASHAVIHSLDVTIPLGVTPVAPAAAVAAVLEQLRASCGAAFGVDLRGRELDDDEPAALVALLSGRTLPDGRTLRTP